MESGFFRGIHKASKLFNRFVILNFLWFLLNLPFLFLFFNIIIANENDRLFFIAITILSAPFTSFPSTIALFAVVRRWIINKNTLDLSESIRSFFKYFKQYYKKSVLIGIIFCLTWSILSLDLYYFRDGTLWILGVVCFVIIFLFVYMINFLCVTVHYEVGWKELFNKSLLYTIASPIQLFAILIIFSSLTLVTFYIPVFILLAFGSLSAYLSFSIFYKQYLNAVNEFDLQK